MEQVCLCLAHMMAQSDTQLMRNGPAYRSEFGYKSWAG
jgi:hypothetical protein